MFITGIPGFEDVDLCNEAINYINDAMAELKTPRQEIREKHSGTSPLKNCITCRYWGECPVDMDVINREVDPFPAINRFGIHCHYYEQAFITPMQYEDRTEIIQGAGKRRRGSENV
jgi:hypothetical protein